MSFNGTPAVSTTEIIRHLPNALDMNDIVFPAKTPDRDKRIDDNEAGTHVALPVQSTPPGRATPPADWFYRVVVGCVVVVAVWLLLTPWVSAISEVMMRRFHLQNRSLATFVATFPIPAMYNYANRYRVTPNEPAGFFRGGEGDTAIPIRYANHYPARTFTFADARYRELRFAETRWVDLESSYRGHIVRSRYRLVPVESERRGGALFRVDYIAQRMEFSRDDDD